jgi:hypothetical protein
VVEGGGRAGIRGSNVQTLQLLLEEAEAVPVPTTADLYKQVVEVAKMAKQCSQDASALLDPKVPKVTLEAWQSLMLRIESLPVEINEEVRVDRVVRNTLDWTSRARAVLDKYHGREPSEESPAVVEEKKKTKKRRKKDEPEEDEEELKQGKHNISYEEVLDLVRRAGGKHVAKIEENCEEMTVLKELMEGGKRWTDTVQGALKSLRNTTTNAIQDEHQARLIREWGIYQLKQLLSHYKHQCALPDLVEPAVLTLAFKDNVASEEAGEDEGDDENDNPLLTLPEMTPLYLKGLTKLRLSKIAHRIDVRLAEVMENLDAASTAVKRRTPLLELQALVVVLERSGQSAEQEPLVTLNRRIAKAVAWQAQAQLVLPPEKPKVKRNRRPNIRKKSKGKGAQQDEDHEETEDEDAPLPLLEQLQALLSVEHPSGVSLDSDDEEDDQGEGDDEEEDDKEEDKEETKEDDKHEEEAVVKPTTASEPASELELVEVPEVDTVQELVAECLAWQKEASRLLAAPDDVKVSEYNALLKAAKVVRVQMPQIATIEHFCWTVAWVEKAQASLRPKVPVPVPAVVQSPSKGEGEQEQTVDTEGAVTGVGVVKKEDASTDGRTPIATLVDLLNQLRQRVNEHYKHHVQLHGEPDWMQLEGSSVAGDGDVLMAPVAVKAEPSADLVALVPAPVVNGSAISPALLQEAAIRSQAATRAAMVCATFAIFLPLPRMRFRTIH